MTPWGQGEGESVPVSLPDPVALIQMSLRWGGCTGFGDTRVPQLGLCSARGQGRQWHVPREPGDRGH